MQRFALAAALLMPLVIDGAFTPVPAKLISEVLIAQDKKSDSTPLAIKDIDRLSKKVKQAIAAGDYQKAIEITKSILQLQEKELGAEHLDTAYSLNSLAIMYVRQNLYSKAEPLYLRAISIYENAKGLEHTDTAITLGNLAHMYSEQGLYNKA
ncbi:MAG TPA: tetratricopeptide repeat protein, partial [Prochlorococcus sp.]